MRKNLIILVLSVIAGVFITTWSGSSNVSACIFAPGCKSSIEQPTGTMTVTKHGFPASYQTSLKFAPTNNNEKFANYAGYAEATTDLQRTNPLLIMVNVVFWFTLLSMLLRISLVAKRRRESIGNNVK